MMRAALLLIVLVGCGSPALKHAGETCTASSECDKGLLCDLGAPQPVCAGQGSLDAAPPVDTDAPAADAPAADASAADAPPADAGMIDGAPADAPALDAPLD